MSTLKHLISTKNDFEQKIIDLFSKYYAKRIKKFYKSSLEQTYIYREFQKSLYELANWPSLKISKEYKKFSKWCLKKYDLTESEIEKLINTLINTSIKLILYTSSNDSIFNKVSIPPLEIFFYKGLKRVARFYYEHPKQEIHSSDIKEIVNIYIQTYIPFKDILNVLDDDGNVEIEDRQLVSYNFDDLDSNSSDSKIIKKNLVIEKQDDSDNNNDDINQLNLLYISSDEFDLEPIKLNNSEHSDLIENEIYQNINPIEVHKENTSNSSNDKDVKYINLPKIKKFYPNKPKNNYYQNNYRYYSQSFDNNKNKNTNNNSNQNDSTNFF